jgi:DNA (cytosine-5)-methyltransferase 1
MSLRHLDLFSGIGGFALAARISGGIQTMQFVEIDSYCQRLLSKNFPSVPIYGDIRSYSANLRQFDVVTAGFPCQDISCANPNGRGLEGERSGLFYELMRVVRECRPCYLVLENVAEMLRKHNGRVMGAILWELSQSGYDAEWQTISAASVGAPHLRERVFIVAYPDRSKWRQRIANRHGVARQNSIQQRSKGADRTTQLCEVDADPNGSRCQEQHLAALANNKRYGSGCIASGGDFWSVEPSVLRVAHGVPHRVDRLKGLGNAVVPQVAAIALRRVLELERSSVAREGKQ